MITGVVRGARLRRMATAWTIALVLGAGAAATARHAWHHLPRPHPLEELSYYPSGQYLKPIAVGHTETAADLAWLRGVQYYGERRLTDNRFDRMAHVFDIITTLSPGFTAAYVFGAFALAQEGGDFPRAEALMMKGIDANPHNGRLSFELGFLYFVRPGGRDLRRAGESFERSARLGYQPETALRFAAASRQHSGDLTVAHELWEEFARSSPNKFLREMAQREMEKIARALAAGRPELATRRMAIPTVQLTRR